LVARVCQSGGMTERRMPKLSELTELLPRPDRSRTRIERRLARDASIADLRRRAKRRTPRAPFDYVDGAAADEISKARASNLFNDIEFRPNVLRDVSAVDASTTFLGRAAAFPFGFAPTGFTRMMHHEGERAVAAVAERVGIPYTLSTLGTTTPEDLAVSAPETDLWFQLYVWKDRDFSTFLIERARKSGYRVLMLTVDLPVAGARPRDIRNGMTIPPQLTMKTVLNGAMHPNWWMNFLTTEPLTFATLTSLDGSVADSLNKIFDPTLTFNDLAWLRDQWSGPIVVKGIQAVDDARKAVDHGASAVVISNHGGRQLDRSPTPLRLVGPVAEAIGSDAEVYVDGGIMNGADIVAAVALGADACFVGRAYLYGLMAGGEAGVQRAADLLTQDILRTMQLLGVATLDDLHPGHVRLPSTG